MTISDDGRAFPDAERDKCSAVSMVWTQADTHRATVAGLARVGAIADLRGAKPAF